MGADVVVYAGSVWLFELNIGCYAACEEWNGDRFNELGWTGEWCEHGHGQRAAALIALPTSPFI